MNEDFRNEQTEQEVPEILEVSAIPEMPEVPSAPAKENYTGFYFQPPESGRKPKEKKQFGMGRIILVSVGSALVGSILACGLLIGFLSYNKDALPNFFNTPTPTLSPIVEINDKTSNAITLVAKKAGPSVVGINVTAVTDSGFFGPQESQGSGSGIIIRTDGYIMTNNHVVDAALDQNGILLPDAKIEVVLPNNDKSYPAKIVGRDSRTDLAVIKIEETGLPAIEFADSSTVEVGTQVVAIGNPGGMELQGSVTVGYVSGLNRSLQGEGSEVKLIQTDASINPGNSGGALVNLAGQLVGVNSSKISATEFEGIGFAIPSNTAKTISDELILNKYVKGRPNIGINIDNRYTKAFADAKGMPEGVYVALVDLGSAAEKAGIKIGDIITKLNGVRTKTFKELDVEKKLHKPGDVISVEIYRDSKYVPLTLTLGEER